MKILRLISLSLVTMVMIPMGVNAHCGGIHDREDHPHCTKDPNPGGGGGTDGGGEYMVLIGTGNALLIHSEMDGDSDDDRYVGKPKGVGLNTSSNAGDLTTRFTLGPIVNFFNVAVPPMGGNSCFTSTMHLQVPIQVGVNKVKKGGAEAMFFFPGLTDDNVGTPPVNYLLILTGDFVSSGTHAPETPTSWPPDLGDPPVLIHMDTWEMKLSGGLGSLASKSCIGGPEEFGAGGVDILITRWP